MNVGMVLGIVFALFIMAFVLVFGTNVVTNIFSMGSQAQVQKAIKNLEKETEDLYYMARGSDTFYKMNIPESYRVCFVNVSDPSKQLYPNPANTWNPGFATLYVINQSKYNVWYYTRNNEKGEGYKIPHLSVPRSFCATRNTKLYLVNEGMVKITIKD